MPSFPYPSSVDILPISSFLVIIIIFFFLHTIAVFPCPSAFSLLFHPLLALNENVSSHYLEHYLSSFPLWIFFLPWRSFFRHFHFSLLLCIWPYTLMVPFFPLKMAIILIYYLCTYLFALVLNSWMVACTFPKTWLF